MKKSNKFLIVFSAVAITFGSLFAFAPGSLIGMAGIATTTIFQPTMAKW